MAITTLLLPDQHERVRARLLVKRFGLRTIVATLLILQSAVGTSHDDDRRLSPSLAITGYQRVGERRVSRTQCEFNFRAILTNRGPAVSGAVATLVSWPARIKVLDPTVRFGRVLASGEATSRDIFTVRQDRVTRCEPDDLLEGLRWHVRPITATVADLDPDQLTIAVGGYGTLTVTIQNPEPTPMHVTLGSGAPWIATVPNEVAIEGGATKGSFSVVGRAPGGPVSVTASLNGTSATAKVTVRSRPVPPVVTKPLVEGATLVTGTGTALALITLQVNGAPVGTQTVGLDGRFEVVVAGLHAGQVVTATQTIDGQTSPLSAAVTARARPPAPVVTSPLVAGSVEVRGTGSPDAAVVLFMNGVRVATAQVGPDGKFTLVTPALVAGQEMTATLTVAGVTSIPSAEVVVVEVPPPPLVTGPLREGATTITGGGSAGATVEVFADGVSVGTANVGGAGGWTLTIVMSLVAGEQVTARQRVDGVASALSPVVTVVARLPAPVISAPLIEGNTVIGGTGVAGADVAVLVDGSSVGTTSVAGDGTWSLVVGAPLVAGQQVTATQTAEAFRAVWPLP
jgi:hypothetical protein